PYDYARAIRVFPETIRASVAFKVRALQATGRLEIDVTDRFGHRPVRLALSDDGSLQVSSGSEWKSVAKVGADWQNVNLTADLVAGTFDVSMNDQLVADDFSLAEYVKSVERLSFRTGAVRTEPTLRSSTSDTPDVTDPNPDVPVAEAVFHVDDVYVNTN